MKKFTKVSLIITAVLFALGLVFCSMATVLGGGWKKMHEDAMAGVYDFGDWHFGDGIYYYSEDLEDWIDEVVLFGTGRPGGKESAKDTFSMDDVDRIQMDFDIADVKIVEGKDTENIVVTMEDGFLNFYSSELKGSTLYICYDKDNKNYKYGPEITVALPEGIVLKEIEVNTALGDIDIKKLNLDCTKVDLYTAMGDVNVEKVNATGDIIVYSAMGDVEISDSSFQNANAETAMGNIDIKGSFSGDVTAYTSMGDIDAKLSGQKETYYNYELCCSMGDLKFNGKNYTRDFGAEEEITNEGAKATVSMETGMGDVTLEVNE